MQLGQLAQWTGGTLHGGDAPVHGVSTDTRSLHANELFVALHGEHFDGHEFVSHCDRAAGVLVDRQQPVSCSQIVVADTLKALQQIAEQWRRHCPARITAITGSNGKTSTKEMTAAVLSRQGPTLATQGNLNNHIGVPLSLLKLTPEHRYAVIEMGANHAGEIRLLTTLAQPQVATITCAAQAHLEGFGSLSGVADAKGEIFEGLADDGVAVINAEDPFASRWRAHLSVRDVLTFSANPQIEADVVAYREEPGLLWLRHGSREMIVNWSLEGAHNARNAACAVAQALALQIDFDAAAQALSGFTLTSGGRMQVLEGHAGARLIDDTYNANPDSFRAAIDVLVAGSFEPWLVMGEMGELGAHAERCHQEVAEYARDAGIRQLYLIGAHAQICAEAFGRDAHVYDSLDALEEALRAQMHSNCAVLIKASRSARLERLVERLQAPQEESDHVA